jgi:hypothetical protein
LPRTCPSPHGEELQAYYDDFPERFERPEARRITYAWVIPAIMDEVEIDEDALRRLYDDRIATYQFSPSGGCWNGSCFGSMSRRRRPPSTRSRRARPISIRWWPNAT